MVPAHSAIPTRRQVADRLLAVTSVEALRKETRRSHRWATVFRGFRPQFLTRAEFQRRAAQFASDVVLLHSLCDVFLDSHGVPVGILSDRLLAAKDYSSVDPETRALCRALAPIGIHGLPSITNTPSDADISVEPASAEDSETKRVGKPNGESVVFVPVSLSGQRWEVAADGANDSADREVEQTTGRLAERVQETSSSQSEIPMDEDQSFDWECPFDHVNEAQQAVTLFERSLAAFVRNRLQRQYGDAWLRQGCAAVKEQWKERAGRNKAVLPATLLGYAEIGELHKVIEARANWPLFEPYFHDKAELKTSISPIISLRVSSMHPSERELYLTEQVVALAAMVRLANSYHAPTAEKIDRLYRKVHSLADDDVSHQETAANRIATNLGEFPNPMLVGREKDLKQLQDFWDDEFATVMSISGPGGVGKTALIDAFTYHLLSRTVDGLRPDPEAIIYLTAKDNYLTFMRRSSESRRFATLRRVYECSVETLLGEVPENGELPELRRKVLSLSGDMRVLFVLDNLESLDDAQAESVATFLSDLPRPSKAIVTTRIDWKIGANRIILDGLSPDDAHYLFVSRVAQYGVEISAEEKALVGELTSYVAGFPLALIYCASLINSGFSLREIVDGVRGKQFLEFLEFSFESSIAKLNRPQLQVLLYLALSKVERERAKLLPLVSDEEELNGTLRRLDDMSLIRRSSEMQKRIRFTVHNNHLRDYVKKRAKELLPEADYLLVLRTAKILPSQAGSPSVALEVNKLLERAEQEWRESWERGIAVLEDARKEWGDDPRLLEKLGYYYFRQRNRRLAREMFDRALEMGHESPQLYYYLALVLLYDNRLDLALQYSQTAITLNSQFPRAERLAAECIWRKLTRERLVMADSLRLELLHQAQNHLNRALISEESGVQDLQHNEAVRKLSTAVGRELEEEQGRTVPQRR